MVLTELSQPAVRAVGSSLPLEGRGTGGSRWVGDTGCAVGHSSSLHGGEPDCWYCGCGGIRKAFTIRGHAQIMSMPAVIPAPIVELVEKNDTLKLVMAWIADRFADEAEVDTAIAWEDGEEHEDEALPPAA